MDYPCHLHLLNKILELKKSNTIFIYYLKCLSNLDRKKITCSFDKTRHTQP